MKAALRVVGLYLAGVAIFATAGAALFGGMALVSSGCAHADPVLVSRDSLKLAGLTFEVTAQTMKDLEDAGVLKGADLANWQAFDARFKASYKLATALYDGAVSVSVDGGVIGDPSTAQAAAGVVGNFKDELDAFQALIVTLTKPSGTGGGP